MSVSAITEEGLLLLLELDEPVPCLSSACAGTDPHPALWECKLDKCNCIMPGCNDARVWWDILAREYAGSVLCGLCHMDDGSVVGYRPLRRRS